MFQTSFCVLLSNFCFVSFSVGRTSLVRSPMGIVHLWWLDWVHRSHIFTLPTTFRPTNVALCMWRSTRSQTSCSLRMWSHGSTWRTELCFHLCSGHSKIDWNDPTTKFKVNNIFFFVIFFVIWIRFSGFSDFFPFTLWLLISREKLSKKWVKNS